MWLRERCGRRVQWIDGCGDESARAQVHSGKIANVSSESIASLTGFVLSLLTMRTDCLTFSSVSACYCDGTVKYARGVSGGVFARGCGT